MIRQRISLAVAGAVVATAALSAGLASPASATDSIYDPGFTPATADLVGVGSDTIEIALDYLSKGHGGTDGFNAQSATTGFKVASYAASDGVNASSTISPRGTAFTRPNGSGAGKSLLHAAGNNLDVNFARSSSTLNAGEISDNLQQFPFAVDGLKLAVSGTATNAPASISPADMVKIFNCTYTTWGQIPGYTGPAPTGAIHPLVPQAGSGTLSFFVAQLQAANGGVAVPTTCDGTTQEHSDVDIKDNPNAIAPFSTARAKALTSTIKLLGGFKAHRAVYDVVRGADLSDSVAGHIGDKLNKVFGEDGFICSAAARPLIEAAGFDQLATSADGGVCGIPTQAAVTTFVTTSQVDTDTSLVATPVNGNDHKVTLSATVEATSSPILGTVQFKEDGTNLGTPVDVSDGVATKTLTGVSEGTHSTYTAVFTPTDELSFTPSTSTAADPIVVKAPAVVTVAVVNPSNLLSTGTYGQTRLVAVSATVDGVATTGSVSIAVAGGATSVVPLNSGVAFLTVPGTSSVGTHTVTASLDASASHYAASGTGSLTVTKATTKTSFKFADATIKASTTPKATVTVTINGASSSVKPSGTVTLKYGTKVVGHGTVTNGVALVNLSKFKKKSTAYGIKATFTSTNANYSSSPASATVKLKVS
ncbi:MAG: hypothetical protein JWR83_1988 [Aeromicrobium sp.]|nr:hypothetical protein [Aeromicrobium sp.]